MSLPYNPNLPTLPLPSQVSHTATTDTNGVRNGPQNGFEGIGSYPHLSSYSLNTHGGTSDKATTSSAVDRTDSGYASISSSSFGGENPYPVSSYPMSGISSFSHEATPSYAENRNPARATQPWHLQAGTSLTGDSAIPSSVAPAYSYSYLYDSQNVSSATPITNAPKYVLNQQPQQQRQQLPRLPLPSMSSYRPAEPQVLASQYDMPLAPSSVTVSYLPVTTMPTLPALPSLPSTSLMTSQAPVLNVPSSLAMPASQTIAQSATILSTPPDTTSPPYQAFQVISTTGISATRPLISEGVHLTRDRKYRPFSLDTSLFHNENIVLHVIDSTASLIETIWPKAASVTPHPYTGRTPLALASFVEETLRRSRTSLSTLQVALYYLLIMKNRIVRMGGLGNIQAEDDNMLRYIKCGRRMFLCSLIVASKYSLDRNFSARAWGRISGLHPKDIAKNERAFLQAIDWKLHICVENFDRWCYFMLQSTPVAPEENATLQYHQEYERALRFWRQKLFRLEPDLSNLDLINAEIQSYRIEQVQLLAQAKQQGHASAGYGPSYYNVASSYRSPISPNLNLVHTSATGPSKSTSSDVVGSDAASTMRKQQQQLRAGQDPRHGPSPMSYQKVVAMIEECQRQAQALPPADQAQLVSNLVNRGSGTLPGALAAKFSTATGSGGATGATSYQQYQQQQQQPQPQQQQRPQPISSSSLAEADSIIVTDNAPKANTSSDSPARRTCDCGVECYNLGAHGASDVESCYSFSSRDSSTVGDIGYTETRVADPNQGGHGLLSRSNSNAASTSGYGYDATTNPAIQTGVKRDRSENEVNESHPSTSVATTYSSHKRTRLA